MNDTPIKAKLSHVLYEPECAQNRFLETGGGTEILIKTSLRNAYADIPSITHFDFDDNSHIDCVAKNISSKPPRKAKKPLNLAFFYIAYHGKTWYEAVFNAKMKDPLKYSKYKAALGFLTDPKQKVLFIQFLQIISLEVDSEKIAYLENYYNKTSTYREFFECIPKTKRCDLLSGWINIFMNYYIGSVYSDKEWYINVNTMDTPHVGGSLSRSLNYRMFSYKKMDML